MYAVGHLRGFGIKITKYVKSYAAEHLQENIQEIGIENVGILPQIKKLLSETDLSAKRLSWYFSKYLCPV